MFLPIYPPISILSFKRWARDTSISNKDLTVAMIGAGNVPIQTILTGNSHQERRKWQPRGRRLFAKVHPARCNKVDNRWSFCVVFLISSLICRSGISNESIRWWWWWWFALATQGESFPRRIDRFPVKCVSFLRFSHSSGRWHECLRILSIAGFERIEAYLVVPDMWQDILSFVTRFIKVLSQINI